MSATVHPIRGASVIGGSTAAAACGIDPHKSRIALWAELTGRMQRRETEAMRWGKALEPVIADALNERGYQVERWTEQPAVADHRYPWLVGHPDGVFYDPTGDGLLELKTAGAWSGREWSHDGIPLAYVAQVNIYLHLTGWERALLAVLIGGQRLDVRELARDDNAIARMLVLMEDFMGYVERDEPPPPDSSDSARETLAELFPRASGKAVRLLGDDWKDYRELVARREQRERVDGQIQELENRLKARMGTAPTAVSPNDEEVLRWSDVTATRLDAKKVKAEYPDVYEACKSTTESRRFSVVS